MPSAKMPLVKIQNGDTGDQARGKLDAAFNLVDAHDTDIVNIQGDVIQLQSDVEVAQSDILTIQGTLNNNTGDISNAQGDIVVLDGKVNVNEGRVDNIENVELPAIKMDIVELKQYRLVIPNIIFNDIIANNVNYYFLKNTATSQNITLETPSGHSSSLQNNGRFIYYIQSGDITFSGGQNIIDTHGAGTYTAPAVVECLLIQGYLVIFDHLA